MCFVVEGICRDVKISYWSCLGMHVGFSHWFPDGRLEFQQGKEWDSKKGKVGTDRDSNKGKIGKGRDSKKERKGKVGVPKRKRKGGEDWGGITRVFLLMNPFCLFIYFGLAL